MTLTLGAYSQNGCSMFLPSVLYWWAWVAQDLATYFPFRGLFQLPDHRDQGLLLPILISLPTTLARTQVWMLLTRALLQSAVFTNTSMNKWVTAIRRANLCWCVQPDGISVELGPSNCKYLSRKERKGKKIRKNVHVFKGCT